MDNALLYFNEIDRYEDIEGLRGKREDIFIDFKHTSSIIGRMTEDDKANFSKAASGYAHQQGGVLIWGISTRKDDQEISIATELKPINNVGTFCSALQGFMKAATDPYVDGIQHKVIHDDEVCRIPDAVWKQSKLLLPPIRIARFIVHNLKLCAIIIAENS